MRRKRIQKRTDHPLDDPAAKLMTLHDCVWQLGNTLRDCMNRLETIRETNPELCVEREIAQAKHTLERYAKGPMFYKPHPFGWPFDAYVLRDALAAFAPTDAEIKVTPGRDEPPHRQGPHDDQCEFRRVKTNRCECYRRRMESKRIAAESADGKPDGQAENTEITGR